MANPLMGMMSGASAPGMNMEVLQQVRQAMNVFRALKDPKQAQQMIETFAQQSPEGETMLQMAQGKNPVEVFRDECRKHGKDPDEMMNALGLTPPNRC